MVGLKETRILMGMPVTVEIVDEGATQDTIDGVYDYFTYIDERFSTYKTTSEITAINEGKLAPANASHDMKTVFALAEQTKRETDGYFDIMHDGRCDPSGIVKGWAIYNASVLLRKQGFENFYIDAGGDIQVFGHNANFKHWRVGIRNPFNPAEIVKVIQVRDEGVATSGTYVRGQHIYNPTSTAAFEPGIVSITVIGPDIYEADRFATAAFAMDREGIVFIESLVGFEGYMIDKHGYATFTSGFNRYVCED